MKQFVNLGYLIHILGLLLVFQVKAFGQSSFELTCKAQAKEVALQTYQTCVTEARQQHIDAIRTEYQQKLSELKNHYNKEIKKAAGKESEAQPAQQDENSIKPATKGKVGRSEKSSKTTAKALPKKQMSNGPALPVQTVSDEIKVVPTGEMPIEADTAQVIEDSASAY